MNKEAKHSDAKRPKENQEIIALRNAMSKALEEKRYEHTLGVAYTAVSYTHLGLRPPRAV